MKQCTIALLLVFVGHSLFCVNDGYKHRSGGEGSSAAACDVMTVFFQGSSYCVPSGQLVVGEGAAREKALEYCWRNHSSMLLTRAGMSAVSEAVNASIVGDAGGTIYWLPLLARLLTSNIEHAERPTARAVPEGDVHHMALLGPGVCHCALPQRYHTQCLTSALQANRRCPICYTPVSQMPRAQAVTVEGGTCMICLQSFEVLRSVPQGTPLVQETGAARAAPAYGVSDSPDKK